MPHAHPQFQIAHATDQGPRLEQADAVNSVRGESGLHAFAIADGVGDKTWSAETAQRAVDNATHHAIDRSAAGALLDVAAPVIQYYANGPRGQVGDACLVVAVPFPDELGGGYDIAWVGDSRAWCYDGTELHQLTTDHTYGEKYRQPDNPDWLQNCAHGFDHVLTRTLGTARDSTRIGTTRVVGDHGRLLLTTDGIHKALSHHEIQQAAARYSQPESCAERLITAARNHGSRDNAAVLVADRHPNPSTHHSTAVRPTEPGR